MFLNLMPEWSEQYKIYNNQYNNHFIFLMRLTLEK